MRKRLHKQRKLLDSWAVDAETSDYLLMTQYDELRAIRVEIHALQYKVTSLLKEKKSNGGHPYIIFPFGSFYSSQKNSSLIRLDSFSSSKSTHNTPHSQRRRSNPERTEDLSSTIAMGVEKLRSKRRSLIPPKCYRRMPRETKSFVLKIMVDDIMNETLSEETVTRVCSSFKVSRVEVEAIARYFIEKYKIRNIAKLMTV